MGSLKNARESHGCTSYSVVGQTVKITDIREHLSPERHFSKPIQQFLFVTGGWTEGFGCLDSTEIYDPTTENWRLVDKLPMPMSGLKATTIDSRVLVFGNKYEVI